MKRIWFCSILWLCFAAPLFAQDRQPRELQYSNRFALRATPTSLLSRYGGHIPVGVEYLFLKNFSLIAEGSIPLATVLDRPGKRYDYDFKMRGELRWYFGYTKRSKFYLGFEAFKRYQAFSQKSGSYDFDGRLYLFSSAHMKKEVQGGALSFGIVARVAGKLFVEGYIGTGSKAVFFDRTEVQDLRLAGRSTGFVIDMQNEDDLYQHGGLLYFPIGIGFSWLL
jgi:hypothetical protein